MREFAAAIGQPYDGGPAPATFPIVVAFDAMFGFLDAVGIELSRIVHGDQRFIYERPVVPGDVLTADAERRQRCARSAATDIIATTSEVTDADGALVCSTSATLVHRAPVQQDERMSDLDRARPRARRPTRSPVPTWCATPGPAATATRSTGPTASPPPSGCPA